MQVRKKAITMIGEMICRMEIPEERMAVISLSADSRPNTSMVDTRAAQGMVKARTMGSTQSRKVKALAAGTPLEMYSKTFISRAPVMPNVRMPIAVRNEARYALVT